MRHWMKIMVLPLLAGSLLLLATGCGQKDPKPASALPVPPDTSINPALDSQYRLNRPSEGSLWNQSKASAFEDTKANYVGDTVIVDIVENTSSKMDVNTEASRKSNMKVGVPTLNFLGATTNLGGTAGGTLLGTDFNNSFEGEAKSDRSGQITASIAARVIEVLPNGNLSVYGRRAMKVNNEVQYIVVSGIVRPKDISATNRVQSTYLADSRIEYSGRGALADKQKPGWGTRLIDNIWPW